jgi:DNA-binding transcriptional ArsR family regulator
VPDRERKAHGELVRTLSHPLRLEILEALRGRVAGPSELSRELDRSLDVIAYHAKTLVRCGCLELVEAKPRAGTVEYLFAVTPSAAFAHQDWHHAAAPARAGVTAAARQSFRVAATRALDRASRWLSRDRSSRSGALQNPTKKGPAALQIAERRAPESE